MGKSGVKVIIRTRPTASFATSQIHIDPDENAITVYSNGIDGSTSPSKHDSGGGRRGDGNSSPGRDGGSSGPSNRRDSWRFKFHQVLHNASQEKVYEAIARDIVHGAVVEGVNGTILAYGQTGAGKSFTMIGDTRNYQHRGIAPRAIAQVYEQVENRIEISYTIKVSYMEIYNDRIYDLLEAFQTESRTSDLVVVDDSKGTYVRGLTQIDAPTEQDALDLLFNGELHRTIAEHQLNKRSNRSHCIFTLLLTQKSRVGGNERVTHSKLNLVDLAGSERLKKTMEEGMNSSKTTLTTIKKESMYINQSLSFLEQCIVALGSKEQRHIPYRQTKLTNVLKDSLGGNANTLMFACIWGESKHLEETISTLKLAQRMMRVQNEVASIIETDPSILLRKYEKQIKELKHELVMHDALVERTGIVYDEHTPEQKMQLMRMIRQYVDATGTVEQDDKILQLNSMHDIRELFRQFKILYKAMEAESMHGNRGAGSVRTHSAGSNASRTLHSNGVSQVDRHSGSARVDGGQQNVVVGEEDPASVGFGVGIASGAARPSSVDGPKKKHGRLVDEDTYRHRSPSPTRAIRSDDKPARDTYPEDGTEGGASRVEGEDREDGTREDRMKNGAFQFYKTSGAGKKVYRCLQEEKDKQLDSRQKVKAVSNQVNIVKERIDHVRAQLDEKRCHRNNVVGTHSPTRRGGGSKEMYDEVVDEEEFILMTAEREAKRDYRSLFDDLKVVKAELEFTNRSVEMLRMRLVREFEDWYEVEGHQMAMAKQVDDEMEEGGGRERESGGFGFGFGIKNNEDKLDDGEKFDQMEVERIRAQDPDSLAFFQAQKKMRQQQSGGAAAQRKTQKSKRGV